MPTRLYRFHCTDGYDLVIDRRGKRMPTLALMRRHAERVALDLMRLGDQIDWSAWQVEVYDAKGWSIWMRTFAEVRDARPEARHQGNARMAMMTTFVVQTFVIKRKRLVPGDREVAPTESGALKKAEAMAGRLPGTAALKIVADDETGELEGATILGRFGEVPDDFPESLQGG